MKSGARCVVLENKQKVISRVFLSAQANVALNSWRWRKRRADYIIRMSVRLKRTSARGEPSIPLGASGPWGTGRNACATESPRRGKRRRGYRSTADARRCGFL